MQVTRSTDFTVEVEAAGGDDGVDTALITIGTSPAQVVPYQANADGKCVARLAVPGGIATPGDYPITAVSTNAGGQSDPLQAMLTVTKKAPGKPVRLSVILGV